MRARITLLEGNPGPSTRGQGGNTVDDFSIKNAASQLDKLINRWAADVVRAPPAPLQEICASILNDVVNGLEVTQVETTPMQVQCYLRHAMAETISEGIINCLIVTNSSEANVQLTRIHEHIFARDPTVACVWRRQTFSAAVESCTPDMSLSVLYEQIPELMKLLNARIPASGGVSILDSAYAFSRMLHGSGSSSSDAFYRAFVPELGSTLYPRQIELVKRCLKSERGELDRVGATIFPGLVKVSRGPASVPGQPDENIQTVVRRAQVICECAMGGSSLPSQPTPQPYPQDNMQQGPAPPFPPQGTPGFAQTNMQGVPPSPAQFAQGGPAPPFAQNGMQGGPAPPFSQQGGTYPQNDMRGGAASPYPPNAGDRGASPYPPNGMQGGVSPPPMSNNNMPMGNQPSYF